MNPKNFTESIVKTVLVRMKYRDHEFKQLQKVIKNNTCAECRYRFGDNHNCYQCPKCKLILCKRCKQNDWNAICQYCKEPTICKNCKTLLTSEERVTTDICDHADGLCFGCAVVCFDSKYCSWTCCYQIHPSIDVCSECKTVREMSSPVKGDAYCAKCNDYTRVPMYINLNIPFTPD